MNEQIKCACTNFYEDSTVKYLLGDIFHPGGLELTEKLGELLHLSSTNTVLDVASGEGISAIFLAKIFGCSVTGVDLSTANIKLAQQKVKESSLGNVHFKNGDAEKLPALDGEFSTVVSECAFCTFPDKTTAAGEMYRVLKPGGKIGITDMVVDQDSLPDDMKTLLYHAACVADARTAEEYITIFENAGFQRVKYYDCSYTLNEMTSNIRKQLLLAKLAVGLKKLNLGEIDSSHAKKMLAQAEDLMQKGVIGYGIIIAERE